ncbi:MAG: 16S rRNA (guanine(527)-N(7))-methyltransferase RsmG [Dehalococcoidia bacterium]
MESLVKAADTLGVTLDDLQQAAFRRYFELLEEGGGRANLTGAHGWERVRDELFVRSLRVLTPAPGGFTSTAAWFDGRRVIDVGTGAGIPGLVLKLALPGMRLTLIDAARKRCDFLQWAVGELELRDVEVVHGRAEDLARDTQHREAYELVLARAVAQLPELAELTLPFASLGGTVIAAKGPDISEEIAESEWAASQLGALPAISQAVTKPGPTPADTLVYWFKVQPTPDRFPRRAGIPHSNPLLPGGSKHRSSTV